MFERNIYKFIRLPLPVQIVRNFQSLFHTSTILDFQRGRDVIHMQTD